MSKFVVVGSIRCVVDAESASEAEEIVNEYLYLAGAEDGIDGIESITIRGAVEVDE